jgi:hypothetical protein
MEKKKRERERERKRLPKVLLSLKKKTSKSLSERMCGDWICQSEEPKKINHRFNESFYIYIYIYLTLRIG